MRADTTFGNLMSIGRPTDDSDWVSLQIFDHTIDEGVTIHASTCDDGTAFTSNIAKNVATRDAKTVSTGSAVCANPIEVPAPRALPGDGCRYFPCMGFEHREVMELHFSNS